MYLVPEKSAHRLSAPYGGGLSAPDAPTTTPTTPTTPPTPTTPGPRTPVTWGNTGT